MSEQTQHVLGLTTRQMQVLRLVIAGRTNAQIAADLGIAYETVRDHLRQLRQLATDDGERDQRWLVRVAYHLGRIEERGHAA